MVLQARLPRTTPGLPRDLRKVQGVGRTGKAEKAYTKNAVYRDKVNRGDYEKEGWMAHKGQRKQRKNDRNGPQAIKPGGFGDKRQGVPGGVQRMAAP